MQAKCIANVGTAEAFAGIINKEFLTVGVPSKVVDLDKFEPDRFRYVIHLPDTLPL